MLMRKLVLQRFVRGVELFRHDGNEHVLISYVKPVLQRLAPSVHKVVVFTVLIRYQIDKICYSKSNISICGGIFQTIRLTSFHVCVDHVRVFVVEHTDDRDVSFRQAVTQFLISVHDERRGSLL